MGNQRLQRHSVLLLFAACGMLGGGLDSPCEAALIWTQATGSAGWTARYWHRGMVFDGKMWVIAGYTGTQTLNDVWSSADGATWTEATRSAPWAARWIHGCLTYAGRMWMIGGEVPGQGPWVNDVWYSTDGATWLAATTRAPWMGRSSFSVVEHNGRMWVLGGFAYANVNDVWSSTNGVNWTMATGAAGWSARYQHVSLAFDNRMWVFGGYRGSAPFLNDSWSSGSGAVWTQAAAASPWSRRRIHAGVAAAGRMWLLGGLDESGAKLNDVWSSTDGIAWTQDTGAASWPGRYAQVVLENGGRIWLMGGVSDDIVNDVWYADTAACTPPSITVHPESLAACAGGQAAITVAASGAGPLAYQWRKNGVGIQDATEDALFIDNVVVADSGTYDVEISNTCGTAISDAATLVVWSSSTGDVNADGTVDGRDIAVFIEVVRGSPTGPPGSAFCAADLLGDGVIDDADLAAFVARLLRG